MLTSCNMPARRTTRKVVRRKRPTHVRRTSTRHASKPTTRARALAHLRKYPGRYGTAGAAGLGGLGVGVDQLLKRYSKNKTGLVPRISGLASSALGWFKKAKSQAVQGDIPGAARSLQNAEVARQEAIARIGKARNTTWSNQNAAATIIQSFIRGQRSREKPFAPFFYTRSDAQLKPARNIVALANAIKTNNVRNVAGLSRPARLDLFKDELALKQAVSDPSKWTFDEGHYKSGSGVYFSPANRNRVSRGYSIARKRLNGDLVEGLP